MTLIIKEDETSLERTPPYGAESFHAYYLKIKENLDYIRKHKFAKVCFETSILETMFVLDEYPEIKNDFLELINKKKISFVGGTYGQPHMQTLTSESNYRQLEEGLKKYRELFGVDIKLYAAQEPGHHEQIPQLLNAFGIRYATLPTFTYSIVFLEPYELVSFMEMAWMKFTKERGMEQDQITRICFTKGFEFARWVGIDQSEVNLYLIDPMRWCRREDIRNEYKKDLLGSPDIRLYLTDLLDFNPEIVKETLESSEFVLADDAIDKRFNELQHLNRTENKKLGPKARLYSYYSYLEGSKGDVAFIKNRQLENLLISAQAFESYLLLNKCQNLPEIDWDKSWKVALETQHHDVCYINAPLLQEWASGKIDKCIEEVKSVTQRLKESLKSHLIKDFSDKFDKTRGYIVLFNSEPHVILSVSETEVPDGMSFGNLVLEDSNNEPIDYQIREDNNIKTVIFSTNLNGFGIKTLKLSQKNSINKIAGGAHLKEGLIDNKFYKCKVNKSGELLNIYLKNSGETIFTEPANRLSAFYNNEEPIEFSCNNSNCKHETGPVFDTIITEGSFDKSIYKKEIIFYKNISRIDFKVFFNFNNQQLGNAFLDETKLCITWPVKNLKNIYHDIPFGFVEGMKSRPLYCLNWINCELDSGKSFTLFPKGKIKFFEKDGILYNLLAWGDEGLDFMRVGGTCASEILKGHFDLRLNGEYTFEYSLYLHESNPARFDLFKLASSYNRPAVSFYTEEKLQSRQDIIFKFSNENISSTSIFCENKEVFCRFFECNGENSNIKIEKRKDIAISTIKDISGREINKIKPFKIARLGINNKIQEIFEKTFKLKQS